MHIYEEDMNNEKRILKKKIIWKTKLKRKLTKTRQAYSKNILNDRVLKMF